MMFARTSRAVRVLDEPRRTFDIARRFEGRMSTDLRFVLFGAFFHVGLDVKLTPNPQKSRDLIEKVGIHDEPFGVLLLPPRVGEVQVKRFDATVGTKPRQSFPSIRIEHSSACTKAGLAQALIHDSRPLETNLQPQKPTVGCCFGPFEKKTTSPGTDLDFDRTFSRHE